MVLETSVYSPSCHVMRLLARESFIESSRRESFRLHNNNNKFQNQPYWPLQTFFGPDYCKITEHLSWEVALHVLFHVYNCKYSP
jgi:hypothetical protein